VNQSQPDRFEGRLPIAAGEAAEMQSGGFTVKVL
jgi:hypothetical protein